MAYLVDDFGHESAPRAVIGASAGMGDGVDFVRERYNTCEGLEELRNESAVVRVTATLQHEVRRAL